MEAGRVGEGGKNLSKKDGRTLRRLPLVGGPPRWTERLKILVDTGGPLMEAARVIDRGAPVLREAERHVPTCVVY